MAILVEGMPGAGETQSRIRPAGDVDRREIPPVDGYFGPSAKSALAESRQAYRPSVNAPAGSRTFGGNSAPQGPGHTHVHFTHAELNQRDSGSAGGEFRSTVRDSASAGASSMQHLYGAASSSRHLYGAAADPTGGSSFCQPDQRARDHGCGGTQGPGHPDHNDQDVHDHTDVRAGRAGRPGSAPNRGATRTSPSSPRRTCPGSPSDPGKVGAPALSARRTAHAVAPLATDAARCPAERFSLTSRNNVGVL